jgi:hypothetical protein
MREPLGRLQAVSLVAGIVTAGCGLLRSVAALPLPGLPSSWQLPLHGVVFTFGVLAALAARRRMRWLDEQRWKYATQVGASADERKMAHEEAERGRRAAARSFGAAPLGLAYWLAYQVEPGSTRLIAWMLPLTAMAGLGIGFLFGGRGARDEGRGTRDES